METRPTKFLYPTPIDEKYLSVLISMFKLFSFFREIKSGNFSLTMEISFLEIRRTQQKIQSKAANVVDIKIFKCNNPNLIFSIRQ